MVAINMDFTTILNQKGTPSAVSDVHLQQFPPHIKLTQSPDLSARPGATHDLHSSMMYRPTSQPAQALQPFYPAPHYQPTIHHDTSVDARPPRSTNQPATKTHHCSTCGKSFARRSDLSRHERIHSNDRPHICDWQGCGKRFIQRSALTVHMRVHTGEKPHICVRCGKPFSDSSSLARHRRIHSGNRPFTCPYPNCQRTFTRRATLTRHKNSHSGALDAVPDATIGGEALGNISDSNYTESSCATSVSPGMRGSLSPAHELPPLHFQRSVGDFYMSNTSLPHHMRSDLHPATAQHDAHAIQAPDPSPHTAATIASHHRPFATSYPTMYAPPQPLEPPANTNQDPHRGSVSGGSPHMSSVGNSVGNSVGWNSPAAQSLDSAHSTPMTEYTYPEPASTLPLPHSTYPTSLMPQIYYPAPPAMRRTHSTEVDHYDMRPRMDW